MVPQSISHRVAKVLVDLMFYGGAVCVLLVPWLSPYLQRYFGFDEAASWLMIGVLLISGICAVYILFNLKQMYQTLLGGNPFVESNVGCFRRMAVSCAVISLVYLIKCFILFSIATAILALMFAVGTLFCLTLKDLFKQAVFYKQENDWTV